MYTDKIYGMHIGISIRTKMDRFSQVQIWSIKSEILYLTCEKLYSCEGVKAISEISRVPRQQTCGQVMF